MAMLIALPIFLLGPGPASARSTATWQDPENDATEQGVTGGLPNDPAFDVTGVTLETVGDKFRWTVEVPQVAAGVPSMSAGYYFRLGFTHYGVKYWFIVAENVDGITKFFLLPLDSKDKPEMTCDGCTGSISRQAKAVIVEAPVASLNEAFAAVGAPSVKDVLWTDLYVLSQRRAVALNLTADTAILSQRQMANLTLTADTANAPTRTVFAF